MFNSDRCLDEKPEFIHENSGCCSFYHTGSLCQHINLIGRKVHNKGFGIDFLCTTKSNDNEKTHQLHNYLSARLCL